MLLKRLVCGVLIVLLLLGCGKNRGMDKGLQLRDALLKGAGCSFQAKITADYGEKQYAFSVDCNSDNTGNLTFQVVAPESICGITGTTGETGGGITFDDQVLAFPLLSDGLLSPVSGPWIFLHSLRSGYINACQNSADETKIIIHDSFQQASLEVIVYCDSSGLPYFAEIIWEGMRIITLEISDFAIM